MRRSRRYRRYRSSINDRERYNLSKKYYLNDESKETFRTFSFVIGIQIIYLIFFIAYVAIWAWNNNLTLNPPDAAIDNIIGSTDFLLKALKIVLTTLQIFYLVVGCFMAFFTLLVLINKNKAIRIVSIILFIIELLSFLVFINFYAFIVQFIIVTILVIVNAKLTYDTKK